MSAGEKFERLVQIMHTLRRECPWDRSQTYDSLRAYLLEETHEVLEALDGRRYGELCEELGDLMLQVVFQAELSREAGRFTVEDVVETISEKLVRRHPHVFGDAEAETPDEVFHRWESIKTGVENKGSVLAGVPTALPALLRAARVLSKIRQAGVDPLPPGGAEAASRHWVEVLAGTEPGREEAEGAAGMLCLSVVALAEKGGTNPEDALRRTVGRLEAAFRREEAALSEAGRAFADLTEDERREMAGRLRAACEGRQG